MKFKLVMAIVLSLISFSALPLTGKDKWTEIRNSREVLIQQPTFAAAFGPQGLFNACATEDEFRSRNPVKICLSYKVVMKVNANNPTETYKDYECAEYESRQVSISRTYNQSSCIRHAPMDDTSSGECIEYGNATSVYPTSFQLAVIEAEGSQYGNFIFSKAYAVPSCF
jgi:hypothetical protein